MTKNPLVDNSGGDLLDRRVFRENSQSSGTSSRKEAHFPRERSKSWNFRGTNNFCGRQTSCKTKEFRRNKESRGTGFFAKIVYLAEQKAFSSKNIP